MSQPHLLMSRKPCLFPSPLRGEGRACPERSEGVRVDLFVATCHHVAFPLTYLLSLQGRGESPQGSWRFQRSRWSVTTAHDGLSTGRTWQSSILSVIARPPQADVALS